MNAERGRKKDIVHLRDVHFKWPGERSFALKIDEFALKKGERLLLLGPSGSGKSTLLSLLAGIVTPREGHIEALGTDINRLGSAARDHFRAEHFGIFFQMFSLLPHGAVIDNVVLPLSFAPQTARVNQWCGRRSKRGTQTANGFGN